MRRTAKFLLFLPLIAIASLPACQRAAPPAAPARPVAASKVAAASAIASAASTTAATASGAVGDDLETLMRAAFPAWKPGQPQVLVVPHDQYPDKTRTVAVQPSMVVAIDKAHRALVTVGRPSDENGEDASAHADPGMVGVYLFERRTDHWIKTKAQDAATWQGSSGEVGDVKVIELGSGHRALLVEGGFTGQGETTVGADVVEIEPAGARVVLSGLPLHEDTFGAANLFCEEWVSGERTPTSADLADPDTEACQAYTGTWRVERAADAGRGDFVVAYKFRRTVDDAKSHSKRFEASERTVVFRYGPSGYVKLSGELPKY